VTQSAAPPTHSDAVSKDLLPPSAVIGNGESKGAAARTNLRFWSGALALLIAALGGAAWYTSSATTPSMQSISPAALSMPTGPAVAVLRFRNPSGEEGDRAQSESLSALVACGARQGALPQGRIPGGAARVQEHDLPNWWWNQVELAYTYGQLGDMENARAAVTKLLELYPGFDLEKAVTEHEKFSFERSYIDHAVDGLRKAGVPKRTAELEEARR